MSINFVKELIQLHDGILGFPMHPFYHGMTWKWLSTMSLLLLYDFILSVCFSLFCVLFTEFLVYSSLFIYFVYFVYDFYPRDAMLARVFATATCPDVCHTPVLCLAERKQDREMYTIW